MAFSGITKLISQLTEVTSASDADNLIIGGSDTKKITFSNLKKSILNISNLSATTSISDSDNLIVSNTDAKKITWARIIALIKTKLNIGSTSLSGIGDGTITGAIKQNAADLDELNGNLKIKQTYATLSVNEHGMLNVRSICPDDRLVNVILINEQYEIRQVTTGGQVFYRIFNTWTGSSVSTGNYYVKVIYVE